MNIAPQPFEFVTASYLTRIGNQKASNLAELARGLDECSDASIFYHTFESLRRHHFLTEGFSNDFAQWVQAACNCPELAERLASLDIREYVSLSALRNDLKSAVDTHGQCCPSQVRLAAFEPFFFCESVEVEAPLGLEARTLQEFRAALAGISLSSFHYHFITSRLRLHLRANDFSMWLGDELGLKTLARRASQIDIYTNTLEGAREKLLALVDTELR